MLVGCGLWVDVWCVVVGIEREREQGRGTVQVKSWSSRSSAQIGRTCRTRGARRTRCPRGATGGEREAVSRGTDGAIGGQCNCVSRHASGRCSRSQGRLRLVLLRGSSFGQAVRLKNGGAASASNRRPQLALCQGPAVGVPAWQALLGTVPRWPVRSLASFSLCCDAPAALCSAHRGAMGDAPQGPQGSQAHSGQAIAHRQANHRAKQPSTQGMLLKKAQEWKSLFGQQQQHPRQQPPVLRRLSSGLPQRTGQYCQNMALCACCPPSLGNNMHSSISLGTPSPTVMSLAQALSSTLHLSSTPHATHHSYIHINTTTSSLREQPLAAPSFQGSSSLASSPPAPATLSDTPALLLSKS
jgi:hypothetical protein